MPWVRRILFLFFCVVVLGALTLFLMGYRANAGRNHLEIEINRPAADVFPWLTESDKLKQWVTGLTDVTQLTPGPMQVGTKARDTIVEGNQKMSADVLITEFEANKILGVHLETDAFANDVRYELSEHEGRTRLQATGHATYKIWLARLMEPLLTPAIQQSLQDDLEKLKKLVEAQR
jgi:uncharacterized protein YndB with AHSA1/START domain